METEFVIIGGGIIGSSIAREIGKRKLGEVIVLEKEEILGKHSSGRNSGVIHSGINQDPNKKKLKAEMCVRGSRILREYCKSNNVPILECGTLVVANSPEELSELNKLFSWGVELGVPELKIIDSFELIRMEQNALGVQALYSPSGAIVDSLSLLKTISNESNEFGAKYFMGEEVKSINENIVTTNSKSIRAKHIINCAGLYADKIAHMVGVRKDLRIIPFRGDYLEVPAKINSMIYQVPDLRFPFLGVHLTKTLEGKVIAGPTATISFFGRESYNNEFSLESLEDIFSPNFFNMLNRLIFSKDSLRQVYNNLLFLINKKYTLKEIKKIYKEEIDISNVSNYKSGIRAQMVDKEGNFIDDFLIEQTQNSTHILNAVSPGLTCSLAFAEYVVNNYIEK